MRLDYHLYLDPYAEYAEEPVKNPDEMKKELFRLRWNEHYRKTLDEYLEIIENDRVVRGREISGHEPLIKIRCIQVSMFSGTSKFDLDSEAIYLKETILEPSGVDVDYAKMFRFLLIQTSIYRVLMRLLAEMGHRGLKHYLEDAFQESYFHFRTLTKNFRTKKRRNKELEDYLMYIERYLFYKLYHWYLVDVLSYKYVRTESRVGTAKYVPRLACYNPIIPSDHLLNLYVDDLLSIIATRNPLQAECVKMHYLLGYQINEIAYIKNMNENTVKSYIHRAKETVRKKASDIIELFLA